MILCAVDDRTPPAVTRFADELARGLGTGMAVAENVARPPADTLAEVAGANGAELIVIGSRGRGPLVAALLGSVSRKLLRVAPCPVVVVPPLAAERHALGTNGGHGPVVCGIDGSERALAGTHLAADLAARLGERLMLAHVRDYTHADVPGRLTEHEVVGTAVATLDSAVEVAIEEGPPAHVLLALSARTRARMLMVAPRDGGGMRDALLGSVTSFLAAKAPCPLLVPAPPR